MVRGHAAPVVAVCDVPAAAAVASLDADGELLLWGAQSGARLAGRRLSMPQTCALCCTVYDSVGVNQVTAHMPHIRHALFPDHRQ